MLADSSLIFADSRFICSGELLHERFDADLHPGPLETILIAIFAHASG